MKKFWKWKNQAQTETMPEARTLFLNGTIAEESWFDDDVTPQLFKDELNAGSGDITVWINSPGGDCVAAAQIYNMLMDYKGNVTVKIDGIAASAASVIAMAGTKVLMSPVSMMMIHNPMTVAFGNSAEMQKILFYKTDNGEVRVEILLYQENLWLTQAKMAELFEVQKAAISKHLKNIFESGELQEEAVVSKMETTAADGKWYNTNYYNLDAIIAVGYRVNSKKRVFVQYKQYGSAGMLAEKLMEAIRKSVHTINQSIARKSKWRYELHCPLVHKILRTELGIK